MYAIIENGNKQYEVKEGSVVKFEKLNAAENESVSFNVLMVVADDGNITVGEAAKNATVCGTVVKQAKDKKIIVFKYKAKKNERKKQGHRQPYSIVKIEKISL